MPFDIIRGDITELNVDAIVNAANPEPIIGYGVDAGIHQKAGPRLLAARKKLGPIPVGQAAVTRGFDLPAKYVIHAVGPVWEGGGRNEEAILRQTYDSALVLAAKKRCRSVAFPLLSSGNYGFPKGTALRIAVSAFSDFLMDHDMHIVLAVFDKAAFDLSGKLFHSVRSYIDDNYIQSKLRSEYGLTGAASAGDDLPRQMTERRRLARPRSTGFANTAPTPPSGFPADTAPTLPSGFPAEMDFMEAPPPSAQANIAPPAASPVLKTAIAAGVPVSLAELLKKTDAGFSETLLRLIDRTGKKDAEIYKKANIDRKLFSKIRSNPAYKPSKPTAVAFAIALELDLEETRDFIGRAGFALTHSSKFDIIVEYFILHGNYDVFALNEMLFAFDQPLIGG